MKYYVVDAFTEEVFGGNPAGVCVMERPLSDEMMQKIAFENNLSETAFLYRKEDTNKDIYKLRWFTPSFEIDLCGHATLAAAFVVFNQLERELRQVDFETMSGILRVTREGDLYEMIFPKRTPRKMQPTSEIIEKLGITPQELYSERDLYIVVGSEQEVVNYVPDYHKLAQLDSWLGIVITAKGDNSDFVSRYFCPELLLEDPVTGSSHSSLVPLWSGKTGKEKLVAKQLSSRGGTLYCELCEDNVKISGKAVLYSEGTLQVE